MTRFSRRNSRRMPAFVEAVEPRQMLIAAVAFVEVPIPAAARAADPTLNDLRTVDVQLQLSGGDDFLAADLRLQLTNGSFYNPRAGGNTPVPNAWSAFPYLEYDTFVSSPKFQTPQILGRKEGTGSAVFSSSEINVAWGDVANTGDGKFTIARLTFTRNATGNMQANLFTQSLPGTAQPINTTIAPLTPKITGKVFNDLNANGRQDSGEPNLSNWQVYIDKDNNGRLNSGDLSVRTNNRGEYRFINPGNTSHRVRVQVQDGFRRTAPSGGSYNVTLGVGVEATGKNFGVTQKARMSGFVYNDADRDGTRDGGEAGLGGWRVYIDKDNDGRFDTGEANMRTASNGSWSFNNLAAGTYRVRLVQVGGFVPTSPSSRLITVTLGSGADRANLNFGQRTA